ncbi:MAG: hypothetical protein ACT4O9_10595 [Blastocatellia bacterium]
MALTDKRWQQLHGGYRQPYDASAPLTQLEAGKPIWDELWEELHHQGDVGEASFAAVPHLVRIAQVASIRDWNLYALVSLIEIERHRKTNPPLPEWIRDDYEAAWRDIATLALKELATSKDGPTIHSALGVIAIAHGQFKLGALICYFDESEIDELAEEKLAWSELYA